MVWTEMSYNKSKTTMSQRLEVVDEFEDVDISDFVEEEEEKEDD